MYENPYDKAHELVRAIKDHESYQGLVEAHNMLNQDADAKNSFIQFRKLQMEVNQAEMFGQPVANEKVQQVALEYAKLSRNKLIADVFNAEASFVQMFSDVQQIIQNGIESGGFAS